ALPITVAAGGTVSLPMTFAPQAAASDTGSLTLTSNATNATLTVTLSGTGTAAPVAGPLTASPGSLSFGSVTSGQSSSLTVTVANSGTAAVTISAATVSGTGFALGSAPALPITVAAGGSVSLPVTFAPQAAASDTGSLTLTSNATNATLTVALGGTGTAAAAGPSVALTWASSGSSVAGYFVYRGQISGGPYMLLTASPVDSASYTDTSVSTGQTYYYVVTDVDSEGIQSDYSNQVSVTIPTS
ncbi:MAG: choice-of-anchor D domain-containing protein, partial [Terriglobales bacterium]